METLGCGVSLPQMWRIVNAQKRMTQHMRSIWWHAAGGHCNSQAWRRHTSYAVARGANALLNSRRSLHHFPSMHTMRGPCSAYLPLVCNHAGQTHLQRLNGRPFFIICIPAFLNHLPVVLRTIFLDIGTHILERYMGDHLSMQHPIKWPLGVIQLPQYHAERVHIAGCRQFAVHEQLWGHVRHCAVRLGGYVVLIARQGLRDAKVRQLAREAFWTAIFDEEHVVGGEIRVDDALAVDERKHAGQLVRNPQDAAHVQRPVSLLPPEKPIHNLAG
mmetsp:Transcript_6624/g.16921  ORF Transcript_6624/g.16921 Transcript_6624/m.16921 type:complete len:273 (-) Transcript_6624:964-1782(-)